MILIGLGSNRAGAWGDPESTVKEAVNVLAKTSGTRILRQSGLYLTAGVGPGRPEAFVNAVVALECHCAPEALLRRLKMIERAAGPRSARRWGPRPLDLDIIDYRGRIMGRRAHDQLNATALRNRISLPHPLMHVRPFVLAPLNEIAPDWRHPLLKITARQLWDRMRGERSGRVLKRL
ncbi:MAG: 2-amino-4-hydroxy-6-hydroxymethyldihydropteridine diphosphokinase [Hyphomicrobiaceae bacterium]|nr:2-amino-4-hydroxy-6-hydroxymethyldihydropteridine diphosphokinase [Hyphomicrobiaceae bacterium]